MLKFKHRARYFIMFLYIFLFFIFLLLKLQNSIKWHWALVFIPLFLMDATMFLALILSNQTHTKLLHKPILGMQVFHAGHLVFMMAAKITTILKLENVIQMSYLVMCAPQLAALALCISGILENVVAMIGGDCSANSQRREDTCQRSCRICYKTANVA